MSEFFKAELKDKFLEYASERDDYFDVQLLYDEFLRPNYSLEFAEKLVREIIEYNPRLFDIMSGNGAKIFMLSATADSIAFIEEGGFKAIYVAEEEKWDTFVEQLSSTRKLSVREKVDLSKTKKYANKRERALLYFLISAVVLNFLVTIFNITKSAFFSSDEITRVEIEEKIEEIQRKNIEKQKSLEEEIFSLKAKLEISENASL